jgi:hypothetical protein
LLPRREHVDDAIDCFRRARRVQSTKHQVTCCGCRQGKFDSFEIAHFSDENDVRIFAQCAPEGGSE